MQWNLFRLTWLTLKNPIIFRKSSKLSIWKWFFSAAKTERGRAAGRPGGRAEWLAIMQTWHKRKESFPRSLARSLLTTNTLKLCCCSFQICKETDGEDIFPVINYPPHFHSTIWFHAFRRRRRAPTSMVGSITCNISPSAKDQQLPLARSLSSFCVYSTCTTDDSKSCKMCVCLCVCVFVCAWQ